MPRSLPLIVALTLLLAVACGNASNAAASPSPASKVNTCAKAHQSTHLAYLVVQHLSGQAIERCAGFDGGVLDADMVMKATGIQFQASGGKVCQIDHEPQQVGDCSNEQGTWSMWLYTSGAWTLPSVAYGELQLHDHDALGWRYALSPVPVPSPPIAPQPL